MIKNVKLKVVGVTFEGRQEIIKQLDLSSTITIRREPTNKFDKNAIMVMSEKGQIGYIGKDYATILAPMMDGGTQFNADIAELGEYKDTHYVHIVINEVEVSKNIYDDYDTQVRMHDGIKDSTQLSGGKLW